MPTHKADIKENSLLQLNKELLSVLLRDNTTKKNLIWGTDIYRTKGIQYSSDSYMLPELITGCFGNVIKPRTEKSKREQQVRIRNKAEVFTPAWICNAQNNLVDSTWFGYSDVFNTETKLSWITRSEKILFPKEPQKSWKHYVKAPRLELACGEGPYITSRYDAVTGAYIEVPDRIGFLDRKLRVIGEHTKTEKTWLEWATRAVKYSYGYDWQGDNVLLARENVLYTVLEHFECRFGRAPSPDYLMKLANIIAWNIWQMDGLKFVVPNSCTDEPRLQITMLDEIQENAVPCCGCTKRNNFLHTGIYCNIMDWSEQKVIRFVDMLKGEEGAKI